LKKKGIIWFQQDLRLHDNEALNEATKLCDELYYIYIFDKRLIEGKTSTGFQKIGDHRLQFLIESVEDLSSNLESRGAKLIVKFGISEEILFNLADEKKTSFVFCNRERTSEEVKIQEGVEHKLWTIGQELRFTRGKMLYYTQDLPFPVTHCPDIFTAFRKDVEKIIQIRQPLPIPLDIKPAKHDIKNDDLPSCKRDDRHMMKGGETEGLRRLKYFLWESEEILFLKANRKKIMGVNRSSHLSAWLANGCLSPKMIVHELRLFEAAKGANQSIYNLFFHLLWRDFFRLMAKKHGNRIFQIDGYTTGVVVSKEIDRVLMERWCNGKTGTPLIDACMVELKSTGWLSGKARQITSSYWINDLKQNWLVGAEWFESQLIDYDPSSNYGNWAYMARVGGSTREELGLNVLYQARKFDPKGDYITKWLPKLGDLPLNLVHCPDIANASEGDESLMHIPEYYFKPLIPSSHWS
jgi:deoxyribodipyrimidine photo-lyase